LRHCHNKISQPRSFALHKGFENRGFILETRVDRHFGHTCRRRYRLNRNTLDSALGKKLHGSVKDCPALFHVLGSAWRAQCHQFRSVQQF
jgi:hypothetical protein